MHSPGFNYSSLELEWAPCPICNGRDFEELAHVDRYRMGISTSGCRQCGLVMTNPRPVASAMDEFYRTHYRNYYESVDFPDQDYIRKIHKDVRASYTADFLERSGILDRTARMLDFGCGEGSLLKEISARRPTIETEAVEPGKTFREFARTYANCRVHASLEELQESAAGTFDLITINHVLEHLLQPAEMLGSLRKLLKEGGHLYIDVPAVEAYRSVASLHIGHMFHFSQNTLQALAAASGYGVVSIEHHHPPRHPVSTRCLLSPGNRQARAGTGNDDNREACWDRIRDLQSTAWKYYITSSFAYKAALYLPRRVLGLMSRRGG